jgi:predicted transcriptional regulator
LRTSFMVDPRDARNFLAGIRLIWQTNPMKNNIEISEDLNRRIEMLTSRSTLTRDQIIEDALSHGRSLAWQEKWVAGVQAGIEAADRGDFANEEEIAAVLNKYSQA